MTSFVGAHLNKDKTYLKTLNNIKNLNGTAIQMFISSPLSNTIVDIEKFKDDNDISEIINFCNINKIKLVIHGPYILNLAKEFKINKRVIDIEDCLWINIILNQLMIADLLNAVGVVIHVGKSTTLTNENALDNMKRAISYIISKMDKKTNVKLILETPAGQGTELLTNMNDFFDFYNSFSDKEKHYLKICIDTCHIWNAGYDINDYYNNIPKNNIDDILVIHLNNSKTDINQRKDRHEELFKGKIYINSFKTFLSNLNNDTIIILEKPAPSPLELSKEIKWINKHLLK